MPAFTGVIGMTTGMYLYGTVDDPRESYPIFTFGIGALLALIVFRLRVGGRSTNCYGFPEPPRMPREFVRQLSLPIFSYMVGLATGMYRYARPDEDMHISWAAAYVFLGLVGIRLWADSWPAEGHSSHSSAALDAADDDSAVVGPTVSRWRP